MKLIENLIISKKETLTEDYFLIECQSQQSLKDIKPGQFANLEIENSKNTFLRRPLSIHDVDLTHNTLSFLVKIVGEGTSKLSQYKIGETLNTIFPLGNWFKYSQNNKPLLIGGGCGVAPLLFLAKQMVEDNLKPTILLGVRTKSDVLRIDKYEQYGQVFVTTQDGSMGQKGLVVQHSIFNDIARFNKIFVCGPELMMKHIAKIANKNNIECEVSLENTMACGIGACLCCVTETIRGNECVCTEGPIFNIKDLKWQI